jgi:hypothetical protein
VAAPLSVVIFDRDAAPHLPPERVEGRHPLPVKNGERFAVRNAGFSLAALVISEIINEIKLLPVLTGRRWQQPDEGQR